jgi:hypothetical protein
LNDAETGAPITTATVNLPEFPLEEGEVAIKDYSENEGILDALTDAGVVSDPKKYAITGFALVPICNLL